MPVGYASGLNHVTSVIVTRTSMKRAKLTIPLLVSGYTFKKNESAVGSVYSNIYYLFLFLSAKASVLSKTSEGIALAFTM